MITTELIFRKPKVRKRLMIAMDIVRQSVITSLPIMMQTEIMSATEAIFTASKKEEKRVDFRKNFKIGFNNATKIKEGKKTANVEIIAPQIPLI